MFSLSPVVFTYISKAAKYTVCFVHFPGVPTHILLNTTGLSPPARADQLELLSITGNVIKTLPIRYYPHREPYGLYNMTDFIPPNEAFFLRVTGYDKDGFLFQRVSSVSFSSIIPGESCKLLLKEPCNNTYDQLMIKPTISLLDAPKVIMSSMTPGYYLRRGAISCQVESLIPFTLRFSRDGRRLGVDQLFRWARPRTLGCICCIIC